MNGLDEYYNSILDDRVEERFDKKRGCGWRDSKGIYLVGPIHSTPCCKLPIVLGTIGEVSYIEEPSLVMTTGHLLVYNWTVDGETVQPSQSHRFIQNPQRFWERKPCVSPAIGCPMDVADLIPNALLIWVGEQHYPTALDFTLEARN